MGKVNELMGSVYREFPVHSHAGRFVIDIGLYFRKPIIAAKEDASVTTTLIGIVTPLIVIGKSTV